MKFMKDQKRLKGELWSNRKFGANTITYPESEPTFGKNCFAFVNCLHLSILAMSAILDLWHFLKKAHVRQGKLCDAMKFDFHLS